MVNTRVFFFFFFFPRPFLASCPGLIPGFFVLENGFGVKEKKKAGTGGLCPTVTGTH